MSAIKDVVIDILVPLGFNNPYQVYDVLTNLFLIMLAMFLIAKSLEIILDLVFNLCYRLAVRLNNLNNTKKLNSCNKTRRFLK